MRPLKVSQGTRRDSRVPAGAVKVGMLGALATATIAVPLASATAGSLEGAVPLVHEPESASQPAAAARPEAAPAVELPEANGTSAAMSTQLISSTTEKDEKKDAETDEAAGTGLVVETKSPEVQEIIEETGGESSTGYIKPVNAPITSGYGGRVHPVLGYTKMHDGTDFGAACGAQVSAPKAGTVVAVEYTSASGKRVKIDHGDGTITGYYHLQTQAVTVGQKVEQGDALGEVGSTGRSTGCHLHFAKMDASGAYSDPMSLFQ